MGERITGKMRGSKTEMTSTLYFWRNRAARLNRPTTTGSAFGKGDVRMIRKAGVLVVLSLFALTGTLQPSMAMDIITSATLECKFTTECVETEACQDADFDITVTGTKPVEGQGFNAQKIDSSIFSLDAEGRTDFSSTVINAQDGDTGHLIIAASDGVAKYINLMVSIPMVITYHGNCAMETSE